MKNPLSAFTRLPIRAKLTIWYTVSFMAVLAFSFISFYLVTRNLLLSEIDSSLKSQANEITTLLKDQTISPSSKDLILKTFRITKTNFVLVLNKNNEIVAQSQAFPIDSEFLSKLAIIIENNAKPQYFTDEKSRFYIVPLINNSSLLGTIIVGDSIAPIDEAFGVLFNTLILIFLLFLLPLVLISFLEADISLSPLRDLSHAMSTISTKNLSERVAILNPKDEIGEVGLAFNKLLDRIQKGFIKERQLIHDVSHQLKTPLTAMQSDVEIALAKPRNKEVYQKILENIHKDTTRMSDLLKDMMNFAWAASEDQDKNFTTINLSQILEEVSEITQQLGYEKDINVSTSIIPDLHILGQKEKLFQVFINILENALKYSNKSGTIFIQGSQSEQLVKIIIKDNGEGISKKDLPHIFERFYRGHSNVGEGSGLGLSIAAALVKAHKGTIEVSSQKHQGTTFVISFPLVNTPKSQELSESKLKDSRVKIKRPYVSDFLKEKISHISPKRIVKDSSHGPH